MRRSHSIVVQLGIVLVAGNTAAARAQDLQIGPAPSIDIPMRGTLAANCTVTAPPATGVSVVSTDIQPIGDFSYTCNFTGPAASIRFWSVNGSALVNPENGGQSLPYRFTWQGFVSNATLADTEVSAAVIAVDPGAPPNSVASFAATIVLDDTAAIAGTYSDTIFISIAP